MNNRRTERAVKHDDRAFLARIRVAERHGRMIRTTSVVIAQVWRDSTGRQAKLSRFLKSVEIVAVDDELGRKIGLALAKSATRDVVDGSVVVIAQTGDWIATSDPDDIKHLVATSDVTAAVVAC